jgi:HEAT repeat protein
MILALLLSLLPTTPLAGIIWTPSLEKGLEQSKAEGKVLFLAVNMDGEAANDRMVKKVYTDKAVIEQSSRTLNIIASASEHAGAGKDCARFEGLTCMDHRRSDTVARQQFLKADAQGFVVAPQHLFLGPDGKVILSVPYEISAGELVWCFATAQAKAFPDKPQPLPEGARMPRRVIMGGVFDPGGSEAGAAPPTKAEVQEIIKELRRGASAQDRMAKVLRLILSDDPAAVEYVEQELKSSGAAQGGGRGGGGGGRGGGGGGRGAVGAGRGDSGVERHERILLAIGAFGPPVYLPLVLPFLTNNESALRKAAAVALEQLGSPEALRELQSAWGEEQDPEVKKRFARALGSCGASDGRIQTFLQKQLKTEKNPSNRAALIIGLGYAVDNPVNDSWLEGLLAGTAALDAEAAAAAVALSRRERWQPVIEKLLAASGDAERKAALEKALESLRSGKLATLAPWIEKLTADDSPRPRIFGVN